MKSYLFSVISAALFVAGAAAQSLTVNTPTSVLSCAPLQITFVGGTAPFIIGIFPGATPNGNALVTFTNVTGSPFLWTAVNFASGTSLDITIHDAAGNTAQSAPFTVQSGGSTSCLNGTASGSNVGTATPAGTSPTTGGASTPTGTTPASSESKAGSTGTSTSKSSSPSSSGNAAIAAGIPYGMAGVLGMVVAAVFA